MYKGLSENEVIKSRKEHGSNIISIKKKDTFFKLLLETLGDPIIKILIIALAFKTIILFKNFDWYETIGILIAILLASFISTISEYGSEKAFDKLQEESSRIKVKVRRNGITKEVYTEEIVVNDIVVLESGDMVPADGTLIFGELVIDESSLTGESKEITKDKENNKLYRGTVVNQKMGLMKVTFVGDNTYYGRISKQLQEKKPESPLKSRLRVLASSISKIGYLGALLGFISHLFSVIVIKNNYDYTLIIDTIKNISLMSNYIIESLTLAVTIIIVCVPEGLPMMITLVLSSNMKRMLKNNVLVRKLVGIETAGSLNVLFFDKTGTITLGKPKVIGFVDNKLNYFNTKKDIKDNHLKELVELSCKYNNESSYDDKGNIVGGNITDKAILEFAKDINKDVKILKTTPFNSKIKYSSTTICCNNENITLVKGAFELILSKSKYIINSGKKSLLLNKLKIQKYLDHFLEEKIRIVGLASSNDENINDLTLIGFILIKDSVRPEAKKTLDEIHNAGIKTVMITGDNINTAKAIAKEVGIINNPSDIVIESNKLNSLTKEEIKNIFPNLKVVARALPTDKSMLVDIAKELNLVVGMTGDGVNDAPALKKASVGFSLGSGTEVAKEASDIVILDNNISSISKAILFGRTIFKSIRKFVIFQLSLNICALLVSIIGPLVNVETPVTVMQMLWINMIMDTLAALAFSYEPPLKEYMKEKPKRKDEKIINKYMTNEILLSGIYSSILCILFLKLPIFSKFFRYSEDNKYLMTAFFGLFIFIGIFNSFNARTNRLNILSNIYKNKVFLIIISFIVIVQLILIYFGGDIFRTYGLTFKELQTMILISFSIIPIDLIRKIILRIKNDKTGV